MKAVFEKSFAFVLRMSADMCMCNCARFLEFTLSCVEV
jgi:hypothetical protein